MTTPPRPAFTLHGFAQAALFALTPAAAVSGGLALAPVITLCGAASTRPSLLRQAFEKPSLAIGLLLAFVGWASISSFWSAYPIHIQAPKLIAVCLTGLMFAAAAGADSRARPLVQAAALAALIMLAGLLAVETFGHLLLNRGAQPALDDGNLERNPGRGATVLLALSWGVLAALLMAKGRQWVAVLVLLAVGFFSTQFHQQSNLVAFTAGLAAFGAAYLMPRLAIWAAAAGWALWMLGAPVLTPLITHQLGLVDAVPLSWAARIGIWDYVCTHIWEQPWIGHGLDSSRVVTEHISIRGLDMRGIPLHPHSGSLQVWYETGAVGAVLAAAAILAGGRALVRRLGHDRLASAAACATLVSMGIIANVAFGLWQEWWNATLFIAAAVVASAGVKAAKA